MRRGVLAALSAVLSSIALGQTPSTWGTIQTRVLDRYCTGCHAVGGYPPAVQTGLILTPDSALRKLLNVPPSNLAAQNDTLVRVSSRGGLEGLAKSYFWQKVNAPQSRNIPSGYGSIMPLGLPFLTNGELAFINRWISGGAPENGIVAGADTNLFNDTTRFVANFQPLSPPAQGIQLHLGPFNVWPAQVHDREFLYFIPSPTTRSLYVSRYQIRYRAGSHHLIVYNYPTGTGAPAPNVYRDIRDSLGTINPTALLQLNSLFPNRFFVGTQTPDIDYSFPPGVALEMPPGTGFDINVHSVNRTLSSRQGEVYVNLHAMDSASVLHKARPGNFQNTNIFLAPMQTTTISRAFRFTQNTNIIQMWAHAHQMMTEFRIEGVGGAHHGQLMYYTNDWEHPALLTLRTPIRFQTGDSIRLVTTWHNSTSQPIQWGLRSVDEMQMFFFIGYGDSPSDVNEVHGMPAGFSLGQNYPNPFNPTTTIRFRVQASAYGYSAYGSAGGFTTLRVYDVLGREAATLVNEALKPGTYETTLDASNLSSGVYLYRLTAGAFSETKRMLLLR